MDSWQPAAQRLRTQTLLWEAHAAAAVVADSRGDAATGLAAPAGSSRGGGPSGVGRALAAEASSGTSEGEFRHCLSVCLKGTEWGSAQGLPGVTGMLAAAGGIVVGERRQAPGSI